jgi:hypothetical protein
MSPEEKALLERTLQISEENNQILLKMQKAARLAFIWGIIKLAVIIVPLVAGYFFLQPFLDQAFENYGSIKEFINIE